MGKLHNGVSAFLTRFFSTNTMSWRDVFALLGPVMVDQFFLIGFNFINTAMISSSGTAAISAVNMVSALNICFIQLFVAFGLGGTVLIAQYFGAGRRDMMGRVCNGTVYGTLIAATSLAITFGILHIPVLTLLFGRASGPVMANAKIYMVGTLLAYPGESIVEGVNGCLRGVGRTAISLELSLLMNGVYLAFNFIFVTFMHMGVLGLVCSLNVSRLTAATVAIWTLYRNRAAFDLDFRLFKRVDWRMVKRVLTVAVPFATESFFFNGGKIIMQIMIVSLGTLMITANAIASSWVQLSEIIPNALSVALVPIVGRCVGRRHVGDARKITKSFLLLGSAAFIIVDLSMLPLFHVGMSLFNAPKSILPVIWQIELLITVMHCLVWCASFVLPAALRAAGDAKFTTVTALITMWSFRVAGGYLVGIVWGYGIVGIWLIMMLEWALRAGIFLLRFRGKRWFIHKLI
mgnify:CR=1 FL=1